MVKRKIDIQKLTPQERLALIEELWDSLTAEQVPIIDAQMAELERRLKTDEAGGYQAVPWEEVRKRALRRK